MLDSFVSNSSENLDFSNLIHKYTGKYCEADSFDKGSLYKSILDCKEEENKIDLEEKDVVLSMDDMRLLHYKSKNGIKNSTPLLIVCSLINRHYMLDIQPDKSMIKHFVDGGLDVYLIDWGYPTAKDLHISVDDYISGYLDTCVEFILNQTGLRKVNLLGVCLGGTFSVIYTALHQEKVKNLITMVVPIDFDCKDSLLYKWWKKVDVQALYNAFGVVPGDYMNYTFLYMKPFELNVDKYRNILKEHDNNTMSSFLKMERWIFDCPDETGAMLIDCIDGLVKQNLMLNVKFSVGKLTVDTKKVTCPILCLSGKRDHIVPLSASRPLNEIVGSIDKEFISFDCGHVGMYVSSSAQKLVSPKIIDWLLKHD